ncbi:MAG: DUF3617 domain-containing protein [Thermodesulfobacteriota bacterium]
MKKKVIFFVVIFFMTAASGICASKPDMQPGLWEITSQARMEGSFAMNMPATTTKQCLSEQDFIPRTERAAGNSDCQIKDVRVQGDTVNWVMECPANGVHAEGKVTYHGDTFDGEMVMDMKQQQMRMISNMKGRRLGDCP